MFESTCQDIEGFQRIVAEPWVAEAGALEHAICVDHSRNRRYDLRGYCRPCGEAVRFRVDREFGARKEGGVWIPNWRERLVCPGCGLNNRQRYVADRVRRLFAGGRPDAALYTTEQVTSFHAWARQALGGVRVVGSEYVPGASPGASVDGIRHEDIEALSFQDASFDAVVSSDVLEHVNDVSAAMAELRRVLRPGGVLILTVPFDATRKESVARASVEGGELRHHLEPQYHGNPVSEQGSLVFTDFGWDFVARFRVAGFADFGVRVYWSLARGHLGGPQIAFVGTRD